MKNVSFGTRVESAELGAFIKESKPVIGLFNNGITDSGSQRAFIK